MEDGFVTTQIAEAERIVALLKKIYVSISSKGMVNPLIVTRAAGLNRFIVEPGNDRLCALKALGYKTAPCRVDRNRSWPIKIGVRDIHPYVSEEEVYVE